MANETEEKEIIVPEEVVTEKPKEVIPSAEETKAEAENAGDEEKENVMPIFDANYAILYIARRQNRAMR